MDNNTNNNVPVKTVVTKKVVTTVPTAVVKQVPVNSVDAVNMAREQEQLRQMALQQASMEAQAMSQMQAMDSTPSTQGTVIGTNIYQQDSINNVDNSVGQFNEVNDLMKVVEQKNSPLLIAILALILTIIVVIIIAQVPMLFNL